MKIFENFECSGQNLTNSLCIFLNDKLIPLQILYPPSVSWKITPLYFFSSSSIYFAEKEPIKGETFETFKCSGQKLSNFLSQFWKDKSIPPQVLYQSSVSWKITPLYFFSSNNIHFAHKEPIKMKIFETWALRWKFVKVIVPSFKQVDSSKFLSLFSFVKDYSSVLFEHKQ